MKKIPIYFGVYAIIVSLIVSPYYTEGDQFYYRRVFDFVSRSNFLDGFDFFKGNIGSSEPMLFLMYYFSSFLLGKDVFISIANGCLGFLLGKCLVERRVSVWIFPLFFLNYYLLVLMFSAERLKFSILFAVSFFLTKSSWRWFFLLFSLLSHSQSGILYIGSLGGNFLKQYRERLDIKLINQIFVVIFAAFVAYYYVGESAIAKLEFYSTSDSAYDKGFGALIKPLIFLILTFLYGRKKWMEIIIYHAPILVFCYFVGSERLVVFSYGIFMFYGLGYKRGINFGVIASSLYFSYQGLDFLMKIFEFGNGYYGAAN